MQMKVPSNAPMRPTRSLKNGIASAMRNEIRQLKATHELLVGISISTINHKHRSCSGEVGGWTYNQTM